MRLHNSTAALALLALALGWPRTSSASAPRTELSQFVSRNDVAQLQTLATTLRGKRGYALANHLDDIAISPAYEQIMRQVLSQVSQDDMSRAFSEINIDEFLAPLKSLRPLAARTAAAIAAMAELVSDDTFGELIVETDNALEGGGQFAGLLNNRTISARSRQTLRLTLRGGVALSCLPLLVNEDECLRRDMFRHAAVGMENTVRLMAALSEDRIRALELLRDLNLEPLDLDSIHDREASLGAARASVLEAREYVPSFGLPPEPPLDAGD